MLGFTGDGTSDHLAACASRDEISPGPTMEHGTLFPNDQESVDYLINTMTTTLV